MKILLQGLLVFSIALVIAGCNAGNGEGLDNNGQVIAPNQPDTPVEPPTGPPPDDGSIRPTLASIQENVFTPICVQCHAGSNAPVGLRLDDLETSQNNLINIDSSNNPSFRRVLPLDADNSFLYLKISGAPIAGNQMPLGLPPLDQQTQDTIKQWINDGAAVSASQVIATVNTTIDATELDNTQQLTATISFNQDIQPFSFDVASAQLINPTTNKIISSGSRFLWEDERTLFIYFSQLGDIPPTFNLVLNQPSLSSITSINGYVLDGDMDGYEGGALVHEISQ